MRIGKTHIIVLQGDITRQEVDAIVNAANNALAGGGGVDGAIHAAGGPGIIAETRRLYPEGCPTGSAVITSAGRLQAKWVVHTVGPIWRGGNNGEPQLLTSAYRNSLRLASDAGARSIAFPGISTGVYGYPADKAATVAVQTVMSFLQENPHSPLLEVRFVAYNEEAGTALRKALEAAT